MECQSGTWRVKKGKEAVVATATHHYTGRPEAAVVISVMKCFFFFMIFVLVKQTGCCPDSKRWRETLKKGLF